MLVKVTEANVTYVALDGEGKPRAIHPTPEA
jgi:acyl-CoA hydrolase